MAAFDQKGLEALNQAWLNSEQAKYDAERRASIAHAAGDQYALAEAYTDYSNAEQTQVNLYKSYQMAEQRATQQQQAPQPVDEGTKLQMDIWNQIATGPPEVDQYLVQRWKAGEAVARGADPSKIDLGNIVPGRTTRRVGGN